MITITEIKGVRDWPLIVRGYQSAADRQRAITQLRKNGFNYFVCYRDPQGEHLGQGFALHYSHADWVPQGSIHVDP